jgi:hypothetical protein
MSKPGWHCTYTSPSRASQRRPFTPQKLAALARTVCQEFGHDETKAALDDALKDCGPDETWLTCGQIDLLSDLLLDWADRIDGFQGATLDALSYLSDRWEDFRRMLGTYGEDLPEADFYGVLQFLRSVKDGSLRERVLRLRRAAKCRDYEGDL